MSVSNASPAQIDEVLGLAELGQWAPYRYLQRFGYDIAGQEQRDRVDRQLRVPGQHLVLVEDGAVHAQLSVRPNDDLSDHFDIPFHEVGPLLTSPTKAVERRDAATRLLGAAREALGGQAAVLLLRVEADDLAFLHAAEGMGFRLMETSLSFVNDLDRRHMNATTSSVGVEVFQIDGPDWLAPDQRDRLMSSGAGPLEDHYHADRRLPASASDALFRRRLDRCISGELADAAVARFLSGDLIGVGFWRRLRELEPYGVSMAGDSYGFRLPGTPARESEAFTEFVANNPVTGNRLLDWTTQSTNFPQINMITRQRSIRLCRTSLMLHCWTDEAP